MSSRVITFWGVILLLFFFLASLLDLIWKKIASLAMTLVTESS